MAIERSIQYLANVGQQLPERSAVKPNDTAHFIKRQRRQREAKGSESN